MTIHGGIDGFSREIVYLNAGTDNKSSTVLKTFLKRQWINMVCHLEYGVIRG